MHTHLQYWRAIAWVALALTGQAHGATVTYQFAGALDTVYGRNTNSNLAPQQSTLIAGTYAGFVTYDDSTGTVSAGQLQFASGYGTNNYASATTPDLAKSQWTWGDVTYQLSGTLQPGSPGTLVIGGVLDPLTQTASSAAVRALGTSNLLTPLAGLPPACIAYDPSRQAIVCFEPPANVFGADAFVLSIGAGGSHVLAMDEIIDFCGHANPCSTSWYHFSGAGTAVPAPATAWLLATAMGSAGVIRRRRKHAGH